MMCEVLKRTSDTRLGPEHFDSVSGTPSGRLSIHSTLKKGGRNISSGRTIGEAGDRIVPVAGRTRCSDGAVDDCILCDLTRYRGGEGPGGARRRVK